MEPARRGMTHLGQIDRGMVLKISVLNFQPQHSLFRVLLYYMPETIMNAYRRLPQFRLAGRYIISS